MTTRQIVSNPKWKTKVPTFGIVYSTSGRYPIDDGDGRWNQLQIQRGRIVPKYIYKPLDSPNSL